MRLNLSKETKRILKRELSGIVSTFYNKSYIDAIFIDTYLTNIEEKSTITLDLNIILNDYNQYKDINLSEFSANINRLLNKLGIKVQFKIWNYNLFKRFVYYQCGIEANQALENGVVVFDKTGKYSYLKILSTMEREIGEYSYQIDSEFILNLLKKQN